MRTLLTSIVLLCTAGHVSADVTLTASGSTFIAPLMQKLAKEYNDLHPEVQINYTSTGSGTGIKQISDRSIDFGATDAPMSDQQLKAAHGRLLHIPLTLGAVVPIYNVPGLPANKDLVFSGPLLADIFRGNITRWTDPAILQLNPSLIFPDLDITVVHRSDGSGTTYVFSDYLSAASPEFAKHPGKGTTINWPATNKIGAKGGEGISVPVQRTPGAIGYIELIAAQANKINYGSVLNSSGKPIHASLENVTAAANLEKLPTDLRMSLVDAPGQSAYPISSFTYLLVYKKQPNPQKERVLVEFLRWAVTDGQKIAPDLHYAPLPPNIVKADLQLIDSIGP